MGRIRPLLSLCLAVLAAFTGGLTVLPAHAFAQQLVVAEKTSRHMTFSVEVTNNSDAPAQASGLVRVRNQDGTVVGRGSFAGRQLQAGERHKLTAKLSGAFAAGTYTARAKVSVGSARIAPTAKLTVGAPRSAPQDGKDRTPVTLPDPSDETTTTDGGAMVTRTLLALAFTVLVIYALYRLLKALGKTTGAAGGSPAVEVLSRTTVDKDMQVFVVRLGDRVAVVGKTQHGLQLLQELDHSEAVAAGLSHSINPTAQNIGTVVAAVRKKLARRGSRSEQVQRIDDLLSDGDQS